MFLFFIFYQALQVTILPISIVYLLMRKAKKKPSIGNFMQRIGFVPKTNNNNNNKIFWIHAVSVGEVLSVQHLIKQIKKDIKNSYCYVTTGTISGNKIAQKNLDYDYLSFIPYDLLFPIFLAFKRIKPNVLIIVEAETWPNLLMVAKWLKIPCYQINARITSQSKNRYIRFKAFLKPILNIFKIIFVQSQTDKKNFQKIGISNKKLIVLGNLKAFNVLAKKEEFEKKFPISEKKIFKTLLVGSLHPGELDVYLYLFKNLKAKFKDLKLILAPRHFNWQKELIYKMNTFGYKYFLWQEESVTNISQFINNTFINNEIILVCKLGELFKLYQMADLFFLGGTFVTVGGHNLLEPAVWGIPSFVGPYYFNCKQSADALQRNNALIKVSDKNELLIKTTNILQKSEQIKEMGKNAYATLAHESKIVKENLKKLFIFFEQNF